MNKTIRIILVISISLAIILIAGKAASDLIYKYKYEPCMKHKLTPVYDEVSGVWTNECPKGCKLGSCFFMKTACCPE